LGLDLTFLFLGSLGSNWERDRTDADARSLRLDGEAIHLLVGTSDIAYELVGKFSGASWSGDCVVPTAERYWIHRVPCYNSAMCDISYTVHTFKEGNIYVAYVPELDLSSCGSTNDEARKNIRDAVHGFLQTSADTGALVGILEEAGYVREGNCWHAPEFVSFDRAVANIA
jgi:predicted RNase H-like HicB family nuclease